MSLTAITNATTTWVGNPLILTSSKASSIQSNLYLLSMEQYQIKRRTTEFINSLSIRFFNQVNSSAIKSVQQLLGFVSENGVDTIRHNLMKKESYFNRLFSNESWTDWLENKTPIGKVVSLYCDCVTSNTKVASLIDLLDKKVLEESNRDAEAILEAIKAEKNLPLKPEKVATQSFWSTFLSLPIAEAKYIAPRAFPLNFQLSSLNGNNGFILNGIYGWGQSGATVASAGDVNGDGIGDLILGASGVSLNAGQTYVVFGRRGGWNSSLSLSILNSTNGFILNGIKSGDNSGSSVASAGDVNGDGIGDIIIGAPMAASSKVGQSYLIFGQKSDWSSPFSFLKLNGNNGFILNGHTNVYGGGGGCGSSVASAGDINGDGIGDIIVAAVGTYETYVIFGHKGRWISPLYPSSLNGTNGFILQGIYGDSSVAGAGDINGDGIGDLVVGSTDPMSFAGETYVIFGSKNGWSSPPYLSNLNGTNGFILNGINSNDWSGASVASAGDVNGDGVGDLIVGAPSASSQAGASYVIFGHKGGWKSPLSLSSLNGVNGFILEGISNGDRSGTSVARAGDINGDGIDDLIVGAPLASSRAGASYVIFGHKGGWSSPLSLSTLNGINGFILEGITSGDNSGWSVASAGDVNGDGVGDLIVGAPSAASYAGQSYVVFGQISK